MKYIADFHIHSHYSLATSKELNPESLDYWAKLKGIKLIGTGDFTHPGWIKELKEKLEPAEQGLYRLKPEFKVQSSKSKVISNSDTRFLLTAEISNIYKKAGKTRKIHNVIFAPDFETVDKIQHKLSSLGFNISSDGRPIIGMDAKNLLDLLLNCSPDIFFVPAHIWTPWFSVLGANSGYDSVKECYEELSDNIYAVETGLSSDPPMNWMCSFLDKYTLVSNSDAHSPEKLGRNANIFNTDISYHSLIKALKTGNPKECLGTIELYPQEGKYHYAGHMKCGVCWNPKETDEHKGICPVCGRKITNGVMNRVAELADREVPTDRKNRLPFQYIIPLKELLSEISARGVNSKKIESQYFQLLGKFGSELQLLLDVPITEINKKANEVLAEAIGRMREGKVNIKQGFDGQYGQIKVFNENEIKSFGIKEMKFDDFEKSHEPRAKSQEGNSKLEAGSRKLEAVSNKTEVKEVLPPYSEPQTAEPEISNEEQKLAIEHYEGPALVIAGPGTGKTYILTQRIANLIQTKEINPDNILAVTFTNKAANEMKQRVSSLKFKVQGLKFNNFFTFHSFGLSILKEHYKLTRRRKNFIIIDEKEKYGIVEKVTGFDKKRVNEICKTLTEIKQNEAEAEPELYDIIKNYECTLTERNAYDLDDLLFYPVRIFDASADILRDYRERYKWVLIDEYQDINFIQYQLIKLLMPDTDSNLFAIGDPNQAIYGFRGANVRFISQFVKDYPNAAVYNLKQSYRCSDIIVRSSVKVLPIYNLKPLALKGIEKGIKIKIVRNQTDKSEAEFIARTIEQMIGGLRFFSMDSGISDGNESDGSLTLSDFAVFCRISRQFDAIEKAFNDHSIPYQAIGDAAFFKQEPIVSMLDFVKYSLNPDNDYLKKKLLDRNIIRRTDEPVNKTGLEEKKVSDSLNNIISLYFRNDKSKDEKIIIKLIELSKEFGNDINGFLEYTTLGNSPDTYLKDIENVSLMTLHASKGLEFKCVFIAGCEDGFLPYSIFENQKSDIDEEKRLLYVGMTRAKKYLYLTHADRRFLLGKELHMTRSKFLNNIEKELAELQEAETKKKPKKDDSQLDLF